MDSCYVGEKYKLEIIEDYDADSPREWDNLGKMICWHNRYGLGDKHNFSDVDELMEYKDDFAVILPLYLMDHGSISISVKDFGCPWDSGQIGFIYVDKDTVIKEYGSLSEENINKAKIVLKGEVETYNNYLEGSVYYYEVYEKVNFKKVYEDGTVEHDFEYKFSDSCRGFYGFDIKENGMIEYISDEVLIDVGIKEKANETDAN